MTKKKEMKKETKLEEKKNSWNRFFRSTFIRHNVFYGIHEYWYASLNDRDTFWEMRR
jgi:hypothetical protein